MRREKISYKTLLYVREVATEEIIKIFTMFFYIIAIAFNLIIPLIVLAVTAVSEKKKVLFDIKFSPRVNF